MSHKLVVHVKAAEYDVYVGRLVIRPSESTARDWGNPYHLGRDGDRPTVLRKHKAHVLKRPHLVDMARLELKDQVLGCWCAPDDCHGDFLATLAQTVPVSHQCEPCHCMPDSYTLCNVCSGLYICKHCRGAEGSLPSECPRVRMTSEQDSGVYAGLLNYIAGEWVEGCYDTSGKRNMPFWAGIVHVAERKEA